MRILLPFLILLPFHALAEPLNPDRLVQAEIRPGWITDRGTQMAAVHLTLAAGWKTYWRSPGQAGIPPQFDLAGSDNIAGMTIHWPRPTVFHLNGLQTIGYSRDLVLPIELSPAAPGKPMRLSGTLDLGVCEEVCVPVSVELSSDLRPGPRDLLIDAALDDQPLRIEAPGTCTVAPISDGLRLSATLTLAPLGAGEAGVIELADPTVWVSQAITTRSGPTVTLTGDLVPQPGAAFVLDRSLLKLTLISDTSAVEVLGCSAG